MKEHSIYMGIRDRKIEFFDHNKRWSSISQSLKTQKVTQNMASSAVLIHAEGQKAAIDDKISHFLNFWAIAVKKQISRTREKVKKITGGPITEFPVPFSNKYLTVSEGYTLITSGYDTGNQNKCEIVELD